MNALAPTLFQREKIVNQACRIRCLRSEFVTLFALLSVAKKDGLLQDAKLKFIGFSSPVCPTGAEDMKIDRVG